MAWDEQSASTGLDECAALVRSAEALCSSAPELAVQLAQRALAIGTGVTARDPMAFADVGQARSLSMRAQAVLAGGLVRISHYADAVEPAFAALALAEVTSATEFAAAVRLDLAVCAREVGEPVLGGVVLRPVLESADVRPSMRALALSRLVTCVGHLARRDDLEDALGEADRLVAADDRLSPDARRIERARLSVRTAAYHRWYGDTEDAVAAAKAGLGMLNRLRRELRAECDRLRAQLVLELVCALLDEGELAEAESAAESVVGEPVRATSAAAVGQLMLAVSTRVLLPSGQVGRGRDMLAQSVWMAERHGLDALLADSLTEVSHLDEQAGRHADALEALRSARAAEQRRVRAISRASRMVLTEVGSADVGAKAVTSLLRQASRSGHTVPAPHGREDFAVDTGSLSARGDDVGDVEETPDLLNREGLIRRLRSVRNGERPVALTLLRFEPSGAHRADIDLTELAGRVRAIAPDHAELASSAGDELAVLLPHTTHDQAERFAATIRETARATDWPADKKGNDLSISTGVVQSAAPTASDDAVDAGALLSAARHALDKAEPTDPGTATNPRVPRPTRLHAAGTTPADRDPTSASNTVGTRSGYFHIPTTEPKTGAYAEGGAADPAAKGNHAVPGPAETARDAAASASEAADTAREAAARSTGARRRAESADTPFGDDEEPTRPLPNVAGASESLTVGRAILSSLSIPKGSGGKRRAPGEQTANNLESHPGNEEPGWPSTPGPRATGDPEPGWPQTPGPREAGETTPDWPSWSTTSPTEPAPPTAEQTRAQAEEEKRSAYEQTKAELARMMSDLTAGNLEVPPSDSTNSTDSGLKTSDTDSGPRAGDTDSEPKASIPTPPDPDTIPEPTRRPEIPDPPEPDPIPPTPDEPQPEEPGPPPASEPVQETATTSALRAALEPFGGLPEQSGPPDSPRISRPPGPARSTTPDWSTGATGQDRPTTSPSPADTSGPAESTGPTGPPGITGPTELRGTSGSTGTTGPAGTISPAEEPANPTWSANSTLADWAGETSTPSATPSSTEQTGATSPAAIDWSANIARSTSTTDWSATTRPSETTNSTAPDWSTTNPRPGGATTSDAARSAHSTNSAGSDWSTTDTRPSGATTSGDAARSAQPANPAGSDWSTTNAGSGGATTSGDVARSAQPASSAGSDWSATDPGPSGATTSGDAARSAQPANPAGTGWSTDTARPSETAQPADPAATESARSGETRGSARPSAIDWSADIVRSDETAGAAGSTNDVARSARSAAIDWSADITRSSETTEGVRSRETPRSAGSAAIDWSADILSATAESARAKAGETSITANESGPAEPIIGPQPRPPDAPGTRGRQRGERSDSTTIAGLLAEALAAYQSTADDEDDYHPPRPEPAPQPFEGFDTFAHGRHRSPE